MAMLPQLYKDLEDRMKKAVDATRGEFAAIRTGRANSALLDHIVVQAYGTEMPLKHCATIAVPDPRSIIVQPHDKSIVGDIRKAIESSDIGITPNVDGAVIRLSLPPLNEERRKELVKLVHKRAEEGRIAVRNVRKDGHNHVQHAQREGTITEDEGRRGNEQVQKLTDKFVSAVDALAETKEKEIMEV
jgi:ribosome recycling factor